MGVGLVYMYIIYIVYYIDVLHCTVMYVMYSLDVGRRLNISGTSGETAGRQQGDKPQECLNWINKTSY